jgi:putative membrane protein
MDDDRRPHSVYGVGDEPDPRFSLANERTSLAWMRTALALVAGGVAIVSLASVATLPRWAPLVGALACVGGGLLAVRAVNAWARIERALRLGQPLPSPRALVLLAGGVVMLAVLTVVLALIDVAHK